MPTSLDERRKGWRWMLPYLEIRAACEPGTSEPSYCACGRRMADRIACIAFVAALRTAASASV